jgi:hypothetical protein
MRTVSVVIDKDLSSRRFDEYYIPRINEVLGDKNVHLIISNSYPQLLKYISDKEHLCKVSVYCKQQEIKIYSNFTIYDNYNEQEFVNANEIIAFIDPLKSDGGEPYRVLLKRFLTRKCPDSTSMHSALSIMVIHQTFMMRE